MSNAAQIEKRPRALAFVDTETTGLGADAQVWEVAVVRREVDGTEFVLHEFVSGIDLPTADPAALAVGRFFERHPEHARGRLERKEVARQGSLAQHEAYFFSGVKRNDIVARPEEVARHVRWATHDAVIVGVNPAFDMRVLDKLMRDHGQVPSWYYTPLDMKAASVGCLLGLGESARIDESSYALSQRCGVEPPGERFAHTALADARWAMRWHDELMTP